MGGGPRRRGSFGLLAEMSVLTRLRNGGIDLMLGMLARDTTREAWQIGGDVALDETHSSSHRARRRRGRPGTSP